MTTYTATVEDDARDKAVALHLQHLRDSGITKMQVKVDAEVGFRNVFGLSHKATYEVDVADENDPALHKVVIKLVEADVRSDYGLDADVKIEGEGGYFQIVVPA